MNFLSINIRGDGGVHKADWIRELKIRHRINFICVQETQLKNIEDIKVDRFWDNSDFDYVAVESQGKSGGLFSVWNSSWFRKVNVILNPNFIVVSGNLIGHSGLIYIVNVYAPVDNGNRSIVWSELNFINLNCLLICFFLASGLRVNLGKSKFFEIGVEDLEVVRFASILKCEPASLPFIYLGLSVGANMRLEKNWSPVIEKFKNKLSVWKAKHLSFGGRLTLIKAILSSLPLYYLSLFKAPVKVINKLEGIRRRFQWGGSLNERKNHWVAWDVVINPKDYGGLGVGSLHMANLSLLAKWWWRLKVEDDSI